jgi:hypothetical protein
VNDEERDAKDRLGMGLIPGQRELAHGGISTPNRCQLAKPKNWRR